MAFGGDKVAADASWPGMCQASLVSPLLLLCLPTAPGTWLLLHRAPHSLLHLWKHNSPFCETVRGSSWASWCFYASVGMENGSLRWLLCLVYPSSVSMPVFHLQISWAALEICRKMLTPANHFLSFSYLWNQDLRLIFIAGLQREERRVWWLGLAPPFFIFFFSPPLSLFFLPPLFFFSLF